MALATVDPKTQAFAQALLGALTRFPDPTFYLHTFVDHLHLALGPWIGLRLVDRRASHRVQVTSVNPDSLEFTSVTVEVVAVDDSPVLSEEGIELSLVPVEGARAGLGGSELRRCVAEARRQLLAICMTARELDELGWARMLDRLRVALDRVARKGERMSEQSGLHLLPGPGGGLPGITADEHAALLADFARGLEPLIAEQEDNRLLAVEGLVHLVPTVRYHRVQAEPSLRRLLPPAQEALAELFTHATRTELDAERTPQAVERAARRGFAKLQDALPGTPGLTLDLAVHAHRGSPGTEPRILAVPCTVGRVHWLVLHTLVWTDRTPGWWKALILYRDLVPRVFEHVRVLAQACYCQALFRAFAATLAADGPPDRWLAELRASWRKVGAAFPFPLPAIEQVERGQELPGETSPVRFERQGLTYVIRQRQQEENPFFAEGVYSVPGASWGPLSELSLGRLFLEPVRALVHQQQLKAQERDLETARLVYKVGHPFKHRSANTFAAVSQALEDARAIREGLRDDPSPGVAPEVVERLHECCEVAKSFAQAGSGYGDLVNLLAASLELPGTAALLSKDHWHQASPVDLARVLAGVVRLARNKTVGRIGVELQPGPGPDGLDGWGILPWIAAEGGPVAPAARLYEEILQELVSNAASHGEPTAGRVRLLARVEAAPGAPPALVLENPFRLKAGVHVQPELAPVDRSGAGGAALVAGLVDRLGLGRLEARARTGALDPQVDALGVFTYRLELTGLGRIDPQQGGAR